MLKIATEFKIQKVLILFTFIAFFMENFRIFVIDVYTFLSITSEKQVGFPHKWVVND